MASKNKPARSSSNQMPDLIKAVRADSSSKVKVAVTDIDGVLRGKYLHKDKFRSAVDGGFGFCDVVFGWDMTDSVYDNAQLTGWQHGFPDALAQLDLATGRNVPWDDDVPFFLGDFINADGTPLPLCPRQLLKRVLAARREARLAADVRARVRVVQLRRNAAELGREERASTRRRSRPGMFGYSLLRANANREYFNALMDEMLRFGVPIEGLHTETGPGVYEAAIQFSEALECADRGVLFKTGAKEIGARFGIMPSFMAKWSAQYPGCSGPRAPVADRRQEELCSHDAEEQHARHEQAVRELSRRPDRRADGIRADVLAHHQQLQAAGRRLLGAGQADLGDRQPHRELPRDPGLAEEHAARNALPRRRHQSLPRGGGGARRRPARRRKETEAHRAADHRHQPGRRKHSARAAHAERNDRIFRRSDIARDWFGDAFVDHFAATREWEWRQWQDAVTDWELKRYFEII